MTTVLQEKVVVENANLKKKIKALIRENDSLKAKIVELEDKLDLNSQNSHCCIITGYIANTDKLSSIFEK
ncbi:MAG: hypothetical protein ACR5KV_00055 [Wolbachia sp.]